jgi:hypothetical protein
MGFLFMVTYKINLKDKTIDFYNQQWLGEYYLPLEMFKIKNNSCEGFRHLNEKNWISNNILYSIGKDLSKIFNCDYDSIITKIINEQNLQLEFISQIFKSFKNG